MRRVSSADFVRHFSAQSDDALKEALVLTRNGRDRLVVLGVESYRELLALGLLNERADQDLHRLSEEFNFLSTPDPLPTQVKRGRG